MRARGVAADCFAYTAIAVTRSFVGSPHIDTFDTAEQLAVALGDFEGGELCVESADGDAIEVVETRGAVASVDSKRRTAHLPRRAVLAHLVHYRVIMLDHAQLSPSTVRRHVGQGHKRGYDAPAERAEPRRREQLGDDAAAAVALRRRLGRAGDGCSNGTVASVGSSGFCLPSASALYCASSTSRPPSPRNSRAESVGYLGSPHVGAGCTFVSSDGPVKKAAIRRPREAAALPSAGSRRGAASSASDVRPQVEEIAHVDHEGARLRHHRRPASVDVNLEAAARVVGRSSSSCSKIV